ncbi:MAG: T9SS type A sorting domain-containing protein [Polaribacter sp.]|uniref:T9SS type A sorting domain-containing protein n=1 Tax=Polaribacter sp. TaxID=1920175 RepID=UPI003BAF5C28
MRKWFLVALFGCFFLPLIGQNLTPNTTGSFTYVPSGALSSKSIKVFYHIPNGDVKTMPILMSFHGVERNADDYRDYWISMANANKFMVFAPEFSDAQFSTGDAYNLANIFDDGDNPSAATFNSKDEWTFSVLDPLFTRIKTAVSGTQQKYNAWGHSAGAQFLHRFVMYVPNSNLDIAVCSNAGWYTVPEFSVDFPYGLNKGQLPTNDLKAAFSKKLIVHLGLNDTDPNSAGLRHNTVVDNQQGLNRLVRGRYFFTESQTTSQSLNTAFNWQKDEVSGVAHNAQLMANDALEHVLKSTLSVNEIHLETQLFAYPNPVKNELFFDNSALKLTKVEVFSIQGKLISTHYFHDFMNNQKIDFSKISAGIYFLKGKEFISKIIKE